MKIINNITKIITLFILLFLGISSVSAAAVLNVVLSNQNPDPVSPGNFVFLNVKVSNIGSDDINNAKLEFVENSNFKLAQGEKSLKEIGIIPAYSAGESSSSFYIGKYKVYVEPKTPQGLNTIKVKVKTPSNNYEYEFDVLVQEANPTLTISDLKVDEIEAGSSGNLDITLENSNSAVLNDIVLTLNLNDVEGKILTTKTGSNQLVLGNLNSNEKKNAKFELVVNPQASAQPILLPITISYEDSLGNKYTQDLSASIKVDSIPQISFNLDSQDIYTTGSGKITFAIANPGTSTVKGVQVEILDSEDYELISGDYQYVGNLNPDDFQTIQSEIYIKNSNSATLKVKLSYSDSYNNKKEEMLNIPLKIYTKEELKQLGLSGATNSASSATSYVVWLLIVVIIFFVGRRFGYKKGKKSKRE